MRRMSNSRAITFAFVLVVGLAACAQSESGDTSKTKNSALGTTLVNGEFSPAGGGWAGSGFVLGTGCAANNPAAVRPSLGSWAAASLSFGRTASTVRQAVVVPQPTVVTFEITGNVRGDDPTGWFKVDLSDSDESRSTNRQSGSSLITPKAFRLAVTTTAPNETVSIVLSGRGMKQWMGCYGPVLTKATFFTGTKPAPATTVPETTTSTSTSTTSTSTTSTTSTTTTIAQTTTSTQAPGCADLKYDRSANCENANLRGFDFRTKQILYANFRGADLSGADLRWTNLYGSDFTGANFSGALLTDAKGRGATYVGANFTGAQFEGADFGMSNFTGADMTSAYLFRAKFDDVKFNRANLTGATVSCTSLISADMTGANITNTRFDSNLMLSTIMPDGTRNAASGTLPWCMR